MVTDLLCPNCGSDRRIISSKRRGVMMHKLRPVIGKRTEHVYICMACGMKYVAGYYDKIRLT